MVNSATSSKTRTGLIKTKRKRFAATSILLDEADRFSNHADMSQPLLRELFGPSREEIWRQLASELNANYVDGDFWERGKIQASHAGWLITLEERSEEHTSELQSLRHLVCRLLLE